MISRNIIDFDSNECAPPKSRCKLSKVKPKFIRDEWIEFGLTVSYGFKMAFSLMASQHFAIGFKWQMNGVDSMLASLANKTSKEFRCENVHIENTEEIKVRFLVYNIVKYECVVVVAVGGESSRLKPSGSYLTFWHFQTHFASIKITFQATEQYALLAAFFFFLFVFFVTFCHCFHVAKPKCS